MQKGGYTMDKYLLRIKSTKDQLTTAGEYISDNDVMIAALAGVPKEYATKNYNSCKIIYYLYEGVP